MKISFLGIGLMGAPMVQRLLDAGHCLTLWNRSTEKAASFADRARVADSVDAALAEAEVVVTMLENGAVVDTVLYASGAINALPQGALVVDMSSIAPSQACAHAEQVAARGGHYLDAPVSGGTRGAEAGSLAIMAGGEEQAFALAKPLFAPLGKATYIGPTGSGQLAKLANQAIVGITIGAVSEALLLAAAGGANPQAVREALLGGFAGSKILEQHGERMLQGDFQPGAPSRIQLKDMTMIVDQARQQNMSLPLAEQVLQQYRSLLASGHGELDHSALLLELQRLNQCCLQPASGETD